MGGIFSEIYSRNDWGFGSGVGSLPLNNIEYIEFINNFIKMNGVRSVVDLGCGDWQFSRFIDWSEATYTGFDVVPELIEFNRANFARPRVSFEVIDDVDAIPSADLVVCKDVFQHLPIRLIRQYLTALKPRTKFLLITNDDWPAEHLTNTEIDAGGWRPVRLSAPPFNETAPVVLTWTVKWGGWKPTRKSTCLILGGQ